MIPIVAAIGLFLLVLAAVLVRRHLDVLDHLDRKDQS